MHPFHTQFLAVGIFVGFVLMVYYVSLRGLWERLRGKAPKDRLDRFFQKGWVSALLVMAVVVGTCCILYGFLVEPKLLAVTHHTIETPKIPAGKQVRLVHVADMHSRGTGTREKKLSGLIASLKPDLVLHTGDFFSGTTESGPAVKKVLNAIDGPQYACMGNLDVLGDFDGLLKRAGVKALHGDSVECTANGVPLLITGFPSGYNDFIKKTLRDLPPQPFSIVLYHHPEGFPETWESHADLMLAGHTHGGQVRLPFYGALITLDRYGKRYESGRYDEQGKTLIVSRGLGCEPGVPEVRFLCRPEVVVIDLVGTGSATG